MRATVAFFAFCFVASIFLHADPVPICVSGNQAAGSSCSTGVLTLTFPNPINVGFASPTQFSISLTDRSAYSVQFSITPDQPIYWISSSLTGSFFGGGGVVGASAYFGGQFLNNLISLDQTGVVGPQYSFLIFQQAMSGTGSLELFAEGVVHSYEYCDTHPEIQCNGIAEGTGTFEFGLTPTPEPGALLMMIAGSAMTSFWVTTVRSKGFSSRGER